MAEDNDQLTRALSEGDEVILSTGATATVRRSYPKGYSGEVDILLDGNEEIERVSGLTLPAEPPLQVGPELGDTTAALQAETGEARAPSRRMKD
jgi:hypothetical protein